MSFRIIIVLLSCTITSSYADDFDDGIAIDTPIDDGLNISTNIKYIVRKSLASAKTGKSGSKTGPCGSGNIVIGAGSKVKNVINISTNKGTTAVCGK